MIVYGSSLSPFVRKVLVYLEERGFEYETRVSPPLQPDPELLAISPFGKIPAFVDVDFSISDSTAIIAYLEAKHPEGRLTPDDPRDVARAVWFEEMADTIAFQAAVPAFFNRVVAPLIGRPQDLAAADKAIAEALPPVFAYIERMIEGPYLVGGRLSVADIAVASIFANLHHCDARPDAAHYPKAVAWAEAMHARPSFAKWLRIDNKILQRAA